ncbi:MAG TPA: GxxExxY protein [Candidatus Angelobacter sp.]|jgi:GxxExxY protein
MSSQGAAGAVQKLRYEDLTKEIIGAAIEVHKAVGPGLLEGVYEECLCHELKLRNLSFECQIVVSVTYKGVILDCGYRLDLLVENTVILELKSVDRIHPIFEAQLLTYMRMLQKPVGLLINFNVPILRSGIVRKVL